MPQSPQIMSSSSTYCMHFALRRCQECLDDAILVGRNPALIAVDEARVSYEGGNVIVIHKRGVNFQSQSKWEFLHLLQNHRSATTD
ncbi:predicted protein [Sclerotinia sclerotiorum 1980 UF-70]|uniref:Uncharacterized protein n=1 Tax=Sclerotinia sclerotiorum (strain ATCC 18683 / 1980 / Ss-1) TaxID=665079 RepID=A7F798_SCLS1|nr:predicted protein [Sclerotinia sclerotiorum 1980 UF-70]EDN98619.1 predicted protein [Sclerotinia sclerotiorum 1980 UF-70]